MLFVLGVGMKLPDMLSILVEGVLKTGFSPVQKTTFAGIPLNRGKQQSFQPGNKAYDYFLPNPSNKAPPP